MLEICDGMLCYLVMKIVKFYSIFFLFYLLFALYVVFQLVTQNREKMLVCMKLCVTKEMWNAISMLIWRADAIVDLTHLLING